MRTASIDTFVAGLTEFLGILRLVKRNRINLSRNQRYGSRSRSSLASVKRSFLMMTRDYPVDRFPGVAYQIQTIEPLLTRLIEIFPCDINQMIQLLEEIHFKVESDLFAELDTPNATPVLSTAVPFMPNDLLEERWGILKRILWEVNRCYDAACYNACAAMIRRLMESLIIEVFEQRGLGSTIKQGGEYLSFADLIGKAASEPSLKLTRNTKRVLPEVKFFGDLGAHNRMALVRKEDLDRLHNQIRAGIEELAQNL
jgi:hypothetical protein